MNNLNSIDKQYQKDKFINAVLFFAENTNPNLFGVTKLMKLFFYADFLHYKRYGRSIIGDEYFKLPEGPVPTISYDLFKATLKKEFNTGLEDAIKIEIIDKNNFKLQKIIPIKKSNLKVFSKSDLEVMQEIAIKYYDYTGKYLASETHKIPFIANAGKLFPFDYNVVIEDEEDKKYLENLNKEKKEFEMAFSLAEEQDDTN